MIFTVAVDGPAAAGKGTVSKRIAAHFGFAHLDTGLLYRATAARVIEGAEAIEAAGALRPADLERDDLRTQAVAQEASRVAADPGVRAALAGFQRRFARREGGAVLDGRDIGTVICPEAEAKLYVTATDEARAARRHAELSAKGDPRTLAQVAADLAERDARDAGRDAAPMRPAPDAVRLDTSGLGIDEAAARAIDIVAERMASQRGL